MKVDPKARLKVVARSPFHVYYEGESDAVSARNRIGDFDVLPGHADFFSILESGQIIIETGPDSDPIVFMANNGILTARSDEVLLFVNM